MKTAAALALVWAGFAAAGDVPMPIGERLGGDTGRAAFGQTSFSLPAPNLDARQLRDFSFGNRLFNTNWVQSGSSTASFDGLGPLFNRVSCSGCHVRDGRGRPPEPGAPMESMLVRISVPGRDAHGGPNPHPVYGDQIQDRAIQGTPAEAVVRLQWEETAGRHEDGEIYTLRRPRVVLDAFAYGPIGAGLLTSPRVAPHMIGLGLLEAVPESDLLGRADPEDRNTDGVSGRANRVWDSARQTTVFGRFGWKANQPGLRQQVAGAAAGDIGITSVAHPADACTVGQKACIDAPNGGVPELSGEFLDKLLLYSRTLAVPHRRRVDDPQVHGGESLFNQAGCAACHTTTLLTGDHELAALAHQRIHPFTDLLLHDMGEGLADGRPDFEADGREWRTAPLWGLGLIGDVNGHELLLHDGRARGIAEAILWHGGEAEVSKEKFRRMSRTDREALLAFLRSL
ncbi:MAG: di-heme oxidoreductase family protein [Panacagrimonas sp.]